MKAQPATFGAQPHRHPRVPTEARPARVLHVVADLTGGGMEWSLLRLLGGLSRQSHRKGLETWGLHGVCVLRDGEERMLDQCRGLASTWVLGSQNLGDETGRRGLWARLAKIIDLFGADVVHARATGTWFDAAAALPRGRGPKLILSFHGFTDLAPLSWRRRFSHAWATRRAHALLTVSRDSARMLHHSWGVPAGKIHTISNGVDTDLFRPFKDAAERAAIRDRLGLSEQGPVVICLANLVKIKRIDALMSIWPTIIATHPAAHLVLIGEGPLRSELTGLACRLGCTASVSFLGTRHDVHELLRAGDLLVVPSCYEASSNAVLEGMATGLPMVAFNVGGLGEQIIPGETGWLVPPDSPGDLATAIIEALSDTRTCKQYGRAARRAAVDHHGLRVWLNRYESLYTDLAAGRSLIAIRGEEAPSCAG
ncbi:MAG: glycosyltransferase [Phycisphaerae bacterium]|nr:glycosyltransferase [Phycisphaerae bacterium]